MPRFAFGILLIAITVSSVGSSIASAQTADACRDLYASACTGGNRNDGTGFTVDATKSGQVVALARAKIEREMTPEIAAQLSKDKEYRKLVSKSLGTEMSLPCHFALSFSESCINSLASKAAKLLVDKKAKGFPEVGVQEKYQLLTSPVTKKLQQSADKRFRTYLGDDKKSAEADRMMKEIKTIMIRRVEKNVADPAKRQLLVERIEGIKTLPTQAHSHCGEGDLSPLMTPNAVYVHETHSMTICPGLHLQSNSAYAMSFVIAHEIAHSIGPSSYVLLAAKKFKARIGTREDFEKAHPFAQALDCLRKVPIAGAGILPDAPAGYTYSKARLLAEFYHHTLLEQDEINETFADWLGSDVASEYLDQAYPQATAEQRRFGYSNAVRLFCGTTDLRNWHRSGYRRALTIAALPRVRKQMGCSDRFTVEATCGAGMPEASSSLSSTESKKSEAVK